MGRLLNFTFVSQKVLLQNFNILFQVFLDAPTSLDVFVWIPVCWQNVSSWQSEMKNHWLLTYSSLDSVKCVMGYTQRFTTIEHKGSAALCMGSKSLVSFVSFSSLCCFWTCLAAAAFLFLLHKHKLQLTTPLFLSFSSSLSLPPHLCLSQSLFLSVFLSLFNSFLSMSKSKFSCPDSVHFGLQMRSCLKNSIQPFCILINQPQPKTVKYYSCTYKESHVALVLTMFFYYLRF